MTRRRKQPRYPTMEYRPYEGRRSGSLWLRLLAALLVLGALCFGALEGVVLAGECADPYNFKTVRAAMGALFRQRIKFLPDILSGFTSQEVIEFFILQVGDCCVFFYLPESEAFKIWTDIPKTDHRANAPYRVVLC